MTIGYVHLGAPEHGVSRYGRILAGEARKRPNLKVLEAELRLTGEPHVDRRRIVEAAKRLSSADVVHLQYNCQLRECLWGPGWQRLSNLRLFARTVSAPLVVTLHDLPPLQSAEPPHNPIQRLVRLRKLAPPLMTLRWLRRRASRLLVCSEEEHVRVGSDNGRIVVVPHFVESREIGSRVEAKDALGLSGKRVITLLGYIHRRKGHELMLEALPALPSDVMLIFAGTAPEPESPFVRVLMARAAEMGVADRVRITGFLSEGELASYLAATDLAVCPFMSLSASGSLSTWIAATRPILASDLPQIAEYNALEPGAIPIFRPYSAAALVEAVWPLLHMDPRQSESAIARLRARLLLPSIFDRHLEIYRGVLRHSDRAPEEQSEHQREQRWVSAR